MEKKSWFRRLTDKLYGGLPMSWPAVILFAVGTAVLTAVFLIVAGVADLFTLIFSFFF